MRTWMADSSLLSCESAPALCVLSVAALMTEISVSAETKAALSSGEALKELAICMVSLVLSALHTAYISGCVLAFC